MRRLGFAMVAALAALALTGTAALAVEPNRHKLIFEGGGSHTWLVGNDSPTEADSKFLRLVVDTGEYTAFYSKKSLNLDKAVGQVKNLSFNFRATNPDVVAQRISVIFVNGDIAYLDSHYCHRAIAVSGGAWQRADFTGWKSADCSFFVTGATGGQYFGTSSMSAWQVYATANPDQQVAYTFFIVEAPGTHDVDDITLGSGKLYTKSNSPTKGCTSEGSC